MKKSEIKINKIILYLVIAILLPVALSVLFLFVGEGHHGICSIMPTWNDEDLYYLEIKSVLEYGKPLGYFGFDGSFAKYGTFDAHGWAIILPYIVVSKIIGLKFFSMSMTNYLMLAACIIVFLLLFKPDAKKSLLFPLLLFSPMVLYYINTCMVEGVNYFCGILGAVLLSRYCISPKKRPLIMMASVIVAVFATMAKPTWALLFFPIFILFLSDRLKGITRFVLSGILTFICTILGYIFYSSFTADYFEGIYAIDNFFSYLSKDGPMSAVMFLVKQWLSNLFVTLTGEYAVWMDISKWFVILSLILSIVYWVINKKEKWAYIPFIFIMGTIFGVLLLYLPGNVAIRAIYPASVFAMCFMALNPGDIKLEIGTYSIGILFVVLAFVVQTTNGYEQREYYDKNNEGLYNDITQYMSVIKVNESTVNPWDNTATIMVDITYNQRLAELFLPTGIAVNYCMNVDPKTIPSRYVIVYDGSEEMMRLINEGYDVINSGFYGIAIMEKGNKPILSKTTFIGDSRTNLMRESADMSPLNVISEAGMGLDWMKEQNLDVHVPLISFMGVNDPWNVEGYIEFYKQFDYVVIVTITPVDDDMLIAIDNPRRNSQIDAFNNRIMKENFMFIDAASYMKQYGIETWDGLHYTPVTDVVIWEYICSQLPNYFTMR